MLSKTNKKLSQKPIVNARVLFMFYSYLLSSTAQ